MKLDISDMKAVVLGSLILAVVAVSGCVFPAELLGGSVVFNLVPTDRTWHDVGGWSYPAGACYDCPYLVGSCTGDPDSKMTCTYKQGESSISIYGVPYIGLSADDSALFDRHPSRYNYHVTETITGCWYTDLAQTQTVSTNSYSYDSEGDRAPDNRTVIPIKIQAPGTRCNLGEKIAIKSGSVTVTPKEEIEETIQEPPEAEEPTIITEPERTMEEMPEKAKTIFDLLVDILLWLPRQLGLML